MPARPDPLLDRARARVGESLRGKWKLERLLGVGGMAAVFAATHRNGLRGAVKILHEELNNVEEVRKRFQREGYVANKVGHPGVVRVLDDDVAEDGSVFMVMELLEGETVEALAARRPGRRLSPAEVLTIADLALDVLAAAHERGVVHRDLKPENLFLTTTPELRVLDFGIARLREVSRARGEGTFGTRVGATLGTPGFMSPEQACGRWSEVDARADVWALGATLFTLLAGRRVHEAATPLLILAASVKDPAPSLASVAPDVPAEVVEIIDRSLAFAREERWQSARVMQLAVREVRALHPHAFVAADIGEGAAIARVNTTVPLEPSAPPARPDAASAAARSENPSITTLRSEPPPGLRLTLSPEAPEPATLRRGPETMVAAPASGALAPPAGHAPSKRAARTVIVGAALFVIVAVGTSIWLASRSTDDAPPRHSPGSGAPR